MISTRTLSDSNIHETHDDTHITNLADGKFNQCSVNGRTRFVSGACSARNNPKGDINAFVETSGGKPQKPMGLKNVVREYKSLFKVWRKEVFSNPDKLRFTNFMKLLAVHFKEQEHFGANLAS